MISENYKDNLEKLAQKCKLLSPKYITVKSGPDHNPDYISSVIVNNEIFKGQVCKTKKASESLAALEALNNFSKKILHNNKLSLYNNKICILIDYDNLKQIDNEITHKEISNQNLDIYMFIDKINYFTDKKLPDGVIKILSSSTDISIMTYTGSLLTKNLYDIYFIATRNKFAFGLIEMIKDKNFGWDNKEAYQITRINQIYKILDNH